MKIDGNISEVEPSPSELLAAKGKLDECEFSSVSISRKCEVSFSKSGLLCQL